MGVLGLWQLLAPVGQPVTLESLENKIFAVDISIWLNQAVKGYRDSQGGSVPNAHLLSLFSRLCKLLFYKIRPVIVFDGGFPELKKQTIINRQQRRAAVKQNSRDYGLKILTNYLASQQLRRTIDSSTYNKTSFKAKEKPRDEIFKLPPLPESSQSMLSDSYESNEDYRSKFTNISKEDIKYLNQIDIESNDFNMLPPDVKQEILSTLKESRKHRTWDQYEELPKESNDFSNYQMQCLLKKRKLQNKLEEVQKDIRRINSSSYVSQYTNDHVIGETNKIMSDDTSYYVLLKKIVEKEESVSSNSSEDVKPSKYVMVDTKNAFIRDIENIDVEKDCFLNSNTEKEKMVNLVSTDIKVENVSLDLSDEEYYVDNPLMILATNDKPVQNLEQNMECENVCINVHENDINMQQNSAITSKTPFKTNKQSSDCNTQKVEYDKNYLESYRNENNSEIKLPLTKTKEYKADKESNELATVSNIDEEVNCNHMIVVTNDNLHSNATVSNIDEEVNCNHMNVGTNDNLHSNVVIKKDDKHTEIDLATQGNSASDETHNFKELQYESLISVENQSIEQSSLCAGTSAQLLGKEASCNASLHVSPNQFSNPEMFIVEEKLLISNLELQENLDDEASILEAEQAKQDRQSNTVQDHMVEECKELLQLFGIPYVVSPLEAEAQCAFYDIVDFTHGTITDDSDVWLFGGKRVYKNFFTQQKFVECYKDKEIFTHFGLSREKLVNFALLTGSDYTEGIEGVGPVTAMEIISEFPGEGIDALQKFKNWWQDSNKYARPPENKVRAKILKLVLTQNFPDEKVFDAYLNPEIDSSMEKFTWGRPDLDALRDYTKEKFGWNQNKVDSALLPVLKKLNERDKQMHIDSFFTVTLKKQANLFPSKRIMSALKKITMPQKQGTENSMESDSAKRKSRVSRNKVTTQKLVRKASTASRSRGGGKKKIKSQGPALSESSSDSDS